MQDKKYIRLWNDCLPIIKDNISDDAYSTWFLPIRPLKLEGNVLTIEVPSMFFYEYIEEKYANLILQTLQRIHGKEAQLMYHVMVDKTNQGTLDMSSSQLSGNSNAATKERKEENKTPNPLHHATPQDLDARLNPRYNFNNFIKGDSNILSRTVGETIANEPNSTKFNPTFIYGPPGVGKTHLINAIGMEIKHNYPNKRVLYVSAHLFKVQYTDSIRNNKYNDFINFYQSLDVLIIDDVQEFAGNEKTQNTFFQIFNHLHQNNKRLIMTCDKPPVLLKGMEERLISRFKWGMVEELPKPDKELRKSILNYKIQHEGLSFPQDVVDYIAENINESVRDLEGIVLQFIARSTILNKEIDLDLAEIIVNKSVIKEHKPITIDIIIKKVCEHYGVNEAVIQQKTRKRNVVEVRQIAMYLSKLHTNNSSKNIGIQMGGKNHATVIHAYKTVKRQLEVDKSFKEKIVTIEKTLKL